MAAAAPLEGVAPTDIDPRITGSVEKISPDGHPDLACRKPEAKRSPTAQATTPGAHRIVDDDAGCGSVINGGEAGPLCLCPICPSPEGREPDIGMWKNEGGGIGSRRRLVTKLDEYIVEDPRDFTTWELEKIDDDIFGGGRLYKKLLWEESIGGTGLRERKRRHEQELPAIEQHKLDRERCRRTGADGGLDVHVSLLREQAMKDGFQGTKLREYLEWRSEMYRQSQGPKHGRRRAGGREEREERGEQTVALDAAAAHFARVEGLAIDATAGEEGGGAAAEGDSEERRGKGGDDAAAAAYLSRTEWRFEPAEELGRSGGVAYSAGDADEDEDGKGEGGGTATEGPPTVDRSDGAESAAEGGGRRDPHPALSANSSADSSAESSFYVDAGEEGFAISWSVHDSDSDSEGEAEDDEAAWESGAETDDEEEEEGREETQKLRINTAGATEDPSDSPAHLHIEEVKAAGATADLGGGTRSSNDFEEFRWHERNEQEIDEVRVVLVFPHSEDELEDMSIETIKENGDEGGETTTNKTGYSAAGVTAKEKHQRGPAAGATASSQGTMNWVPIVSPTSEADKEPRIKAAGATADPWHPPALLYIPRAMAAGATASPGDRKNLHVPVVSPTSMDEKEEKEGRGHKQRRKRHRTRNTKNRMGIPWRDSFIFTGRTERRKRAGGMNSRLQGFGSREARAERERKLEMIVAHLRKKGLRASHLGADHSRERTNVALLVESWESCGTPS